MEIDLILIFGLAFCGLWGFGLAQIRFKCFTGKRCHATQNGELIYLAILGCYVVLYEVLFWFIHKVLKMNDLNKLSFYRADLTNISSLVDLINSAYRQKSTNTWTTEADLVLGARISSAQLSQQLQNSQFHLLVAEENNQVVACIGLTFDDLSVEIGTFAISPDWQNRGLGKLVLDYAEKYAIDVQFNLETYVMWVLSVRTELITFYERRGYIYTGVVEDYPINANVGIPQVDLHLIEMRKEMKKESKNIFNL